MVRRHLSRLIFSNYQRAFARIDMFGIKTTKIGYGYLEITAK
jgi:hypothetical protein